MVRGETRQAHHALHDRTATSGISRRRGNSRQELRTVLILEESVRRRGPLKLVDKTERRIQDSLLQSELPSSHHRVVKSGC